MKRVHNFSAGPATLPLSVLEKAQSELANYKEKGASIVEMSHRSPEYSEINEQAIQRLKTILGADDDWEVLFLQGGASTQFLMAPYNFLSEGQTADYIDTGAWSSKAIKEAKPFGNVHIPFSGKEINYTRIPSNDELTSSDDAVYTHITSNNTIFGTQFQEEPETNGSLLICDASSDFLSRPIDLDKYAMIYAGAQKNLGPAGVTVVMIRKSFMKNQKSEGIPTILNYQTHLDKIFNTPPVFAVYLVNYVLEWILEEGGISHFEELNTKKAGLLYSELDKDDFYRGTVEEDSRSKMNVTFRLQNEDLEKTFLSEAAGNDLVALKGHRSVGGIRASIYNACELESVEALVSFMQEFREKNG
ncbi:3-phosphoserine/phosphohydroxythreonine transaminase [Rhodohalobacter sp. 614A]|uniref:3-phosphoserine/phosphohydroxythreonine transaminase n=1 Tax=Rhodohalobacter sp. 614A TaxID=2908649 RepID=UPI001F3FED6D|nr:3-phosphoserine/phosphohydroxythreonine transaminase [Rhodohalobacter sp. 614A]